MFRQVQFSPLQQTLKKVGFNFLPRLKQSINQTTQRKTIIKVNKNKDTLILWNTICIFISDNRLFEIWSLWNLYECKYMKCVQCRKVKSTVFTNTNINVWPLAIHDGLSYEHSLSPLIIANSFNKKKFRIYFIWGKWNIM